MSGYTRLSKILAKRDGMIFFRCPACDEPHGINCGEGLGDEFIWDANLDAPSFSPAIRVTHNIPGMAFVGQRIQIRSNRMCHMYVTRGKIQYLNDCNHLYAGRVVDMIPWDKEDKKDGA